MTGPLSTLMTAVQWCGPTNGRSGPTREKSGIIWKQQAYLTQTAFK